MAKFKKHFNSKIFIYGTIVLFYLSSTPPIYSYSNAKDTLRIPVGARTLERMGQLLDVEGGKTTGAQIPVVESPKVSSTSRYAQGISGEEVIELLEWVAIPFALSYEDKVYARFLGIDETEERSGVSRIASNLRNIEEKIVPAILGNTAGLPISPDTRFIDIGSGSGIVVLYFALRFGIQATGIELDERQYRIAETLKAYLVKEGDIKEDQVTFIHGDATMFPFDSYQIAYYHSPYPTWRATDLDLAIFSKIIKELPLGGQFVSTLKEIPEYLMSEGELTLRTVLANQGDNAGDLNILGSINVIAASIYTKTSSMKPYAYPELLAALSSRQPLDNSL